MREFRRKRVRLGLEGRVRVRVRVENELKGRVVDDLRCPL